MTLTERTAYIKGLCEGLGLDKKDTPEAKIINALIELCEEITLEIEDIESDIGELADYCEEIGWTAAAAANGNKQNAQTVLYTPADDDSQG